MNYSQLALRSATRARQGGARVEYHVRRNDPYMAKVEAKEAVILWAIACQYVRHAIDSA